MILQHILNEDLIEESRHTNMINDLCLTQHKTKVVGLMVKSIYEINPITISKEHITFALEFLGHALSLPFTEEKIIILALRIYQRWLGIDFSQRLIDQRNIPKGFMDNSQLFIQEVIKQLSLIFTQRKMAIGVSDNKYIDLCRQVIRIYNRLGSWEYGGFLSDATWEILLRVNLGVTDAFLIRREGISGPGATLQLGKYLIENLFELWINSGVQKIALFGELSRLVRGWTHVGVLIRTWHAVSLGLTRRLLSIIFAKPFPYKIIYTDRTRKYSHSKPTSIKNMVIILFPDNKRSKLFHITDELVLYYWYRFLYIFENIQSKDPNKRETQKSGEILGVMPTSIFENDILLKKSHSSGGMSIGESGEVRGLRSSIGSLNLKDPPPEITSKELPTADMAEGSWVIEGSRLSTARFQDPEMYKLYLQGVRGILQEFSKLGSIFEQHRESANIELQELGEAEYRIIKPRLTPATCNIASQIQAQICKFTSTLNQTNPSDIPKHLLRGAPNGNIILELFSVFLFKSVEANTSIHVQIVYGELCNIFSTYDGVFKSRYLEWFAFLLHDIFKQNTMVKGNQLSKTIIGRIIVHSGSLFGSGITQFNILLPLYIDIINDLFHNNDLILCKEVCISALKIVCQGISIPNNYISYKKQIAGKTKEECGIINTYLKLQNTIENIIYFILNKGNGEILQLGLWISAIYCVDTHQVIKKINLINFFIGLFKQNLEQSIFQPQIVVNLKIILDVLEIVINDFKLQDIRKHKRQISKWLGELANFSTKLLPAEGTKHIKRMRESKYGYELLISNLLCLCVNMSNLIPNSRNNPTIGVLTRLKERISRSDKWERTREVVERLLGLICIQDGRQRISNYTPNTGSVLCNKRPKDPLNRIYDLRIPKLHFLIKGEQLLTITDLFSHGVYQSLVIIRTLYGIYTYQTQLFSNLAQITTSEQKGHFGIVRGRNKTISEIPGLKRSPYSIEADMKSRINSPCKGSRAKGEDSTEKEEEVYNTIAEAPNTIAEVPNTIAEAPNTIADIPECKYIPVPDIDIEEEPMEREISKLMSRIDARENTYTYSNNPSERIDLQCAYEKSLNSESGCENAEGRHFLSHFKLIPTETQSNIQYILDKPDLLQRIKQLDTRTHRPILVVPILYLKSPDVLGCEVDKERVPQASTYNTIMSTLGLQLTPQHLRTGNFSHIQNDILNLGAIYNAYPLQELVFVVPTLTCDYIRKREILDSCCREAKVLIIWNAREGSRNVRKLPVYLKLLAYSSIRILVVITLIQEGLFRINVLDTLRPGERDKKNIHKDIDIDIENINMEYMKSSPHEKTSSQSRKWDDYAPLMDNLVVNKYNIGPLLREGCLNVGKYSYSSEQIQNGVDKERTATLDNMLKIFDQRATTIQNLSKFGLSDPPNGSLNYLFSNASQTKDIPIS